MLIKRGIALHFLFLYFLLLAACTVQPVSKTKGDSVPVIPGESNVGTGASAQLSLWSRGPQQAANPVDYSLDSRDALNGLGRQTVSLYDLSSSNSNLIGPNLKVHYSKNTSDGPGYSTPLVSTWKNQKVPWDSKEFKSFMLYAHGSRAIRYMKELFPNLNFSVRTKSLFPIQAYSSIRGTPLGARYVTSSNFYSAGNIVFQQNAGDPFNPLDESDAVYHEFAHAFQHVLNPNVLETGGNYDVDMLLEGLADFFAASAVRDERILEYLASNAKYFFTANNRTGRTQVRKMGNTLRFPTNYVGEYHLDARIVSSAFNDIRKYLEGQTVSLYQNCGSTCAVKWNNATSAFSRSSAFDTANILAHEALREIVPQSSIVHYSEKVIAAVNRRSWSQQCGTSSSCKTEIVSEITSILKSRGIYTSSPLRCVDNEECEPFTTSGTSPELVINHNGNLYFAPLFSSTGESNTDSKVDRCEAILVYPDIRVRSGIAASAYDTLFETYDLTPSNPERQVSGFSSLDGIDLLTQNPDYLDDNDAPDVFDTSYIGIKLWGFLLPGENILGLVGNTSSRYYASHQQSVLSPNPSVLTSTNPSPLGWAFKAPATAGAEASIEFAFSTRPFEVRYVTSDVYNTLQLKQKINVSTSPSNFCN